MGAQSKWAYDRVVDYCDGWLPIEGRGEIRAELEELRAAADRAGRSMDTIHLSVLSFSPDEAKARDYIEMGFQRLIFALPPADAATVLPILDQYADIARKLS